MNEEEMKKLVEIGRRLAKQLENDKERIHTATEAEFVFALKSLERQEYEK